MFPVRHIESGAVHRTDRRGKAPSGAFARCLTAVLTACLIWASAAADAESAEGESPEVDVEALVREMDRMRERLDEMEALRERVRVLEQALAEERRENDAVRPEPAPEKRDVAAAADAAKAEVAATDADEDRNDGVEFNGALRFTAFWSDSDEAVQGTRGDSGLDIFRVGASGSIDDLEVSAEYRFYPFMDVIHHG